MHVWPVPDEFSTCIVEPEFLATCLSCSLAGFDIVVKLFLPKSPAYLPVVEFCLVDGQFPCFCCVWALSLSCDHSIKETYCRDLIGYIMFSQLGNHTFHPLLENCLSSHRLIDEVRNLSPQSNKLPDRLFLKLEHR